MPEGRCGECCTRVPGQTLTSGPHPNCTPHMYPSENMKIAKDLILAEKLWLIVAGPEGESVLEVS